MAIKTVPDAGTGVEAGCLIVKIHVFVRHCTFDKGDDCWLLRILQDFA